MLKTIFVHHTNEPQPVQSFLLTCTVHVFKALGVIGKVHVLVHIFSSIPLNYSTQCIILKGTLLVFLTFYEHSCLLIHSYEM